MDLRAAIKQDLFIASHFHEILLCKMIPYITIRQDIYIASHFSEIFLCKMTPYDAVSGHVESLS